MSSGELSIIDKYLTVWIFLVIVIGIEIGNAFPQVSLIIGGLNVGTTSIPIAIGLILMLYPPMTKVRYEEMSSALRDVKLLIFSLFLNWLVGPLLMLLLALTLLWDMPEFMVGVIIIGLARCIGMVIIWNELAGGNRELALGIVAINSIYKMIFYAVYVYLFVVIPLEWLGILGGLNIHVSIIDIAEAVLLYLGTPAANGVLTRYLSSKLRGREWFENIFVPRIGYMTDIALLFTIVIMFSIKGEDIVKLPYNVVRVAIPLTLYFIIMWFTSLYISYKILGENYPESAAVAFTAASNDFELAIAVTIAMFGIGSNQAFATIIGPLIEVPVMISLIEISKKLRTLIFK